MTADPSALEAELARVTAERDRLARLEVMLDARFGEGVRLYRVLEGERDQLRADLTAAREREGQAIRLLGNLLEYTQRKVSSGSLCPKDGARPCCHTQRFLDGKTIPPCGQCAAARERVALLEGVLEGSAENVDGLACSVARCAGHLRPRQLHRQFARLALAALRSLVATRPPGGPGGERVCPKCNGTLVCGGVCDQLPPPAPQSGAERSMVLEEAARAVEASAESDWAKSHHDGRVGLLAAAYVVRQLAAAQRPEVVAARPVECEPVTQQPENKETDHVR